MMEQTTSTNRFGDIVKLLEQDKLPGIDVAAIVEMRRKDIEALMSADRVALEGAQSVGQKQVELLRGTLDQLSSLIQQAAASGSMTEKTTKTRELVQQVLQRALENTARARGDRLQIPVRYLRRIDQTHPGEPRRGEGAAASRKVVRAQYACGQERVSRCGLLLEARPGF
jgi:phasin family protein